MAESIFTCLFLILFVPLFAIGLAILKFLWFVGAKRESSLFLSLLKFMTKLCVKLTASSVSLHGTENMMPKGKNIVYVVNHQSFFDIPLLLGWVDARIRFVAREDLSRVILLGGWLKVLNSFLISRKISKEEVIKFEQIGDALSEGAVVAIFPEGTRTTAGEIGKIHTSALRPAKRAQSTLIPVFIEGSMNINRKNSKIVRPAKVKIIVGKKIEFPEYSKMSPVELAEYVGKVFEELRSTISLSPSKPHAGVLLHLWD